MEEFMQNIHFNSELFSVLVFIFCALMLVRILNEAHKNQIMDWSDLLTINGPSNKVSFPKLLQMVAMFTATWAIIHLTLFSRLNAELFAVYLAYSGGNEAFSKYLSLKKESLELQKNDK